MSKCHELHFKYGFTITIGPLFSPFGGGGGGVLVDHSGLDFILSLVLLLFGKCIEQNLIMG